MNYWIAINKNNEKITEKDYKWNEIKNEIIQLGFYIEKNNQEIWLPKNMQEYIQAKTASADINGRNIKIESRYIGFKNRNNIVIIRICEKTNNITIE